MTDRVNVSDYSMTYKDRLSRDMQAPLIVLGEVVDVREVGEPRKSPGDPRILTQETVISIRVENVIRGRIDRDHIDVVFFAYSRKNQKDLRVRNGPFKDNGCGNKREDCCIADILLRPPPDELVEGFLYDLPNLTYAAAVLCSPHSARESLLRLAQHRDEGVRAGTKDMLSMLGQWFPQASDAER